MEDPILSAYLKEFSEAADLTDLSDADLFEYFASYCVIVRDFSEYTNLEDTIVAGEKDTAIDSISIFLNDIHVVNTTQVDDIAGQQKLDADFCFVQAKTSRALNAAEIGSFIQGVKEFFGPQFMPANDSIWEKRSVSDYVFSKSVKMRSKPKLYLYYCYTGSFRNDETILARVEAGKSDIGALNLFSQISFVFLDSDRLQERYQEINLRIEREIQLNEYASLPQINGIVQAYLGVLPCKELVKLLSNSDGKLHKALFNENVRDFLSRNPVNDEIAATLCSTDRQSRLAALNNGITIVARDIKIVGKKFTLGDYQIVNGCQTSHIVFDHQNQLRDDTSIPVKII